MTRFPYVARATLTGLISTQVLATVHVHLSNARLFESLAAIAEAGYLTIPNRHVMETLRSLEPALYGGLFFTLSLGAGLSLSAIAFAWIWVRLLGRHRLCLWGMGLLWLGVVALMNSHEFALMVSSYFLITPLVAFVSAVKWMPARPGERKWLNRATPVLPMVALTILWSAHADEDLFVNIRDYLLLSNPVGERVDDFYYRYTLYPAEAFKSLEQKTLKTCALPQRPHPAASRRLEEILIDRDYLPVSEYDLVDLEVTESEDMLVFKHGNRTVMTSTYKEFFSAPEESLRYFSAETDGHLLLRQATFLSLLLGFPVGLYVMVYGLTRFIAGLVFRDRAASVMTAVVCFLIGLALLAPVHVGQGERVHRDDVARALSSERWQQRVAGLRTIVDKELDIGDYPAYRAMMASPYVPELYWLAKALGISRKEETYKDLAVLTHDPHPNVVSMAFEALGRRGDRGAVTLLVEAIEVSHHWYNQWYAYRALRRLGWKQTPTQAKGLTDPAS